MTGETLTLNPKPVIVNVLCVVLQDDQSNSELQNSSRVVFTIENPKEKTQHTIRLLPLELTL